MHGLLTSPYASAIDAESYRTDRGQFPLDEQEGKRHGDEDQVAAVEYEFQRAEDHAGNRLMRVRRRPA